MDIQEANKKLEVLEKYLHDLKYAYEKLVLAKYEVESLKIKLREALASRQLSKEDRRKGEETYNRLVRISNIYERAKENLKRQIESYSKEVMKLSKYLPPEKRKEIEKEIEKYKKIWGTVFSIFTAIIFLAALSYFKIIHEAQQTIGLVSLPNFSFNFFNLSVSIIVLIFLILAFRTSSQR